MKCKLEGVFQRAEQAAGEPEDARSLIERARVMRNRGLKAHALHLLDRAEPLVEGRDQAMALAATRAATLRRMGRSVEARDVLQAAVRLGARRAAHPQLFTCLAATLCDLGRLAEACAEIAALIDENDADPPALRAGARVYRESSNGSDRFRDQELYCLRRLGQLEALDDAAATRLHELTD